MCKQSIKILRINLQYEEVHGLLQLVDWQQQKQLSKDFSFQWLELHILPLQLILVVPKPVWQQIQMEPERTSNRTEKQEVRGGSKMINFQFKRKTLATWSFDNYFQLVLRLRTLMQWSYEQECSLCKEKYIDFDHVYIERRGHHWKINNRQRCMWRETRSRYWIACNWH